MRKRYEWRELTEGGLLKLPERAGPYYSQDDINGYDGFDTKEAAIAAFLEFRRVHRYSAPRELVLIEMYVAPDLD